MWAVNFFVKISGAFHLFFSAMDSINAETTPTSLSLVQQNGQTVLLTDVGIHIRQIITFQRLKGFLT